MKRLRVYTQAHLCSLAYIMCYVYICHSILNQEKPIVINLSKQLEINRMQHNISSLYKGNESAKAAQDIFFAHFAERNLLLKVTFFVRSLGSTYSKEQRTMHSFVSSHLIHYKI